MFSAYEFIRYYSEQMEKLVKENQELQSSEQRNKNASTEYVPNMFDGVLNPHCLSAFPDSL